MEAGRIEFFGSLADLETRGVQNMMVKMENQEHGRRTASERWKLFKLVSRIGHQLYRNWPTNEGQKKVMFKIKFVRYRLLVYEKFTFYMPGLIIYTR